MNAPEPDPTELAVAVGEPLASGLLEGTVRVAPVSIPGVDGTHAWAVSDDLGDHPLRIYVAVMPAGDARVLTADQDAWADLARAVKVELVDAPQARAYLESYLELTRGTSVIVGAINNLAELRWRPGSVSEEAAKEALLAAPPDVGPVAVQTAAGFHVELTVVVDQRLQRNSFDVTRDGRIESSYRVLADGLPLPIAR